jgi:hypothetical protein
MSGWKELTSETVLNALPTDMGNLYRSWVEANPTKAGRMGEIVAETVNMFREAVAVYPWYVMDPDITKVPVSGFRHALDMVIFNLGMEMGVQFAPEVYSLVTQANVWLRMVQTGRIRAVDTIGDGGKPRYAQKSECRRQELA